MAMGAELQLVEVFEPEELRGTQLVEGSLELVRVCSRSEVEQRTGWGSEGKGVEGAEVGRQDDGCVDRADARPGASLWGDDAR
jgi:hypothetical protein